MRPEIDISQLSAAEMDELLAKLAARRASVEPAHPVEAPKQAEAIVNPQWFTCLVDPGSLFQIRHPGMVGSRLSSLRMNGHNYSASC